MPKPKQTCIERTAFKADYGACIRNIPSKKRPCHRHLVPFFERIDERDHDRYILNARGYCFDETDGDRSRKISRHCGINTDRDHHIRSEKSSHFPVGSLASNSGTNRKQLTHRFNRASSGVHLNDRETQMEQVLVNSIPTSTHNQCMAACDKYINSLLRTDSLPRTSVKSMVTDHNRCGNHADMILQRIAVQLDGIQRILQRETEKTTQATSISNRPSSDKIPANSFYTPTSVSLSLTDYSFPKCCNLNTCSQNAMPQLQTSPHYIKATDNCCEGHLGNSKIGPVVDNNYLGDLICRCIEANKKLHHLDPRKQNLDNNLSLTDDNVCRYCHRQNEVPTNKSLNWKFNSPSTIEKETQKDLSITENPSLITSLHDEKIFIIDKPAQTEDFRVDGPCQYCTNRTVVDKQTSAHYQAPISISKSVQFIPAPPELIFKSIQVDMHDNLKPELICVGVQVDTLSGMVCKCIQKNKQMDNVSIELDCKCIQTNTSKRTLPCSVCRGVQTSPLMIDVNGSTSNICYESVCFYKSLDNLSKDKQVNTTTSKSFNASPVQKSDGICCGAKKCGAFTDVVDDKPTSKSCKARMSVKKSDKGHKSSQNGSLLSRSTSTADSCICDNVYIVSTAQTDCPEDVHKFFGTKFKSPNEETKSICSDFVTAANNTVNALSRHFSDGYSSMEVREIPLSEPCPAYAKSVINEIVDHLTYANILKKYVYLTDFDKNTTHVDIAIDIQKSLQPITNCYLDKQVEPEGSSMPRNTNLKSKSLLTKLSAPLRRKSGTKKSLGLIKGTDTKRSNENLKGTGVQSSIMKQTAHFKPLKIESLSLKSCDTKQCTSPGRCILKEIGNDIQGYQIQQTDHIPTMQPIEDLVAAKPEISKLSIKLDHLSQFLRRDKQPNKDKFLTTSNMQGVTLVTTPIEVIHTGNIGQFKPRRADIPTYKCNNFKPSCNDSPHSDSSDSIIYCERVASNSTQRDQSGEYVENCPFYVNRSLATEAKSRTNTSSNSCTKSTAYSFKNKASK